MSRNSVWMWFRRFFFLIVVAFAGIWLASISSLAQYYDPEHLAVLWSEEAKSKTRPLSSVTATPHTAAAAARRDEALDETASNSKPLASPPFHYVISTGCSPYQDWQSYVFFYHAMKTGAANSKVTRIVSGCNPEDAEKMIKLHRRQIEPLSKNFLLHHTPDYAGMKPGENYNFFNKPFGLRHWMEEGLGFPNTTELDDTIFVILDPDQIIVHPFVSDMTSQAHSIRWKTEPKFPVRVEEGRPFAQLYGLGTWWLPMVNANLSHVLATLSTEEAEQSHLHHWTGEEVDNHYVAGPPYIATGKDMYRIVTTWAKFVLPVFDLTHDHLSEMHAYTTAAAHLGLSHQLSHSFMVSDLHNDMEDWQFVDKSKDARYCIVRDKFMEQQSSDQQHYIPNVIHYCQIYMLGPHWFFKYDFPNDFLTCRHPLLLEPEINLATKYSTAMTIDGKKYKLKLPRKRRRAAFMICNLISRVNEAAMFWKSQHCDPLIANFNSTFTISFDRFSQQR